MLATVKGRIGHALMHIRIVHCSICIASRYAIHRCHACRIGHDELIPVLELFLYYDFVLYIGLWFTSVVTHVYPYPFSALLSDPCPIVVLVSNGIARRSPRTRGNWSIRCSDLVWEPGWTTPGPLNALPL